MECTCTACGTTAVADHAALLLAIGWRINSESACLCAVCVRRSDGMVRAAREMRRQAVQMRAQAAQMISDSRARRPLPGPTRRKGE
jgi:hypothetical protein